MSSPIPGINVAWSAECGRALATLTTHGPDPATNLQQTYGHITILFCGDFWKGIQSDRRVDLLRKLATFSHIPFTVQNPERSGTCVRFQSPELGQIRRSLLATLTDIPNAFKADRDQDYDYFHSQIVDRDHAHLFEERVKPTGLMTSGTRFIFTPATGFKTSEIVDKKNSRVAREGRHKETRADEPYNSADRNNAMNKDASRD